MIDTVVCDAKNRHSRIFISYTTRKIQNYSQTYAILWYNNIKVGFPSYHKEVK